MTPARDGLTRVYPRRRGGAFPLRRPSGPRAGLSPQARGSPPLALGGLRVRGYYPRRRGGAPELSV